MAYLENNNGIDKKTNFFKKKWIIFVGIILLVLLAVGGFVSWKTGVTISKVFQGGTFSSLIHALPGVEDKLKGEDQGRINIALLGMRGEKVDGGGLLADTIMVVSVDPAQKKAAMISVPRDLYVTVPGTQDKQKINAVHFYGEEKGRGQGLKDMETILSEVTGLEIDYAISINFEGFKKLIDTIGGIEITLDQPFEEAIQFNQPHVCDSFFNVPTGTYEEKTVKYYSESAKTYKTRVVKKYPLCTAPKETLECGGDFKLPAGTQTLDGDKALCYARSRYGTSDFERAKRQQIIVQLIKDKLLSTQTLMSFDKMNQLLDNLGENVRTDFQPWEMKRLFDIYQQTKDYQVYQRVLENSEEGMLYNPPENGAGYILLPIGDSYDRIHEMVKNIFTLSAQSDIKPRS